MMQVVFTPWTDKIKKINSGLGWKFVFNAFFYSEISLESLFIHKNRDFAKNRKKLNFQLKIVKNLVECLKTRLSLNDSSKTS
jgi:hypothetical protein